MRRLASALVLIGFLYLTMAQGVGAHGVTVYIQRVLVAQQGNIRLGDLVQPFGDTPASARETLALAVASVSSHLLYMPSQSYMDRVEDAFGRDSIFVGSRSLVIPAGAVPDNEIPLLDRLIDFLADTGVLGNEVADIEVRSIQLVGTPPQTSIPLFQLVKPSRDSLEISFSDSGSGGDASGKIILALKGDPRAAAADIRASDPVRVIFHKGPITIEMKGRALDAAAVGETVSVLLTDSQKSFSGKLLVGKAVDVELP
jgi:hypothetical protein